MIIITFLIIYMTSRDALFAEGLGKPSLEKNPFFPSIFCQAQPKPQPANPQLGSEIALFSQLWGTTIHPTGPE